MTVGSASTSKESLLTFNFLLACGVTLTSYGSFYFLLATLPLYVQKLGGSEGDVGLVMGVFVVTSLALRPFIGQGSDRWGPKRLIVIGSVVMAASPLLYALANTLPPLLAVRVLHGVGWAAAGTAASALVAEIAPAARRGEAMGYFGMAGNLAMALAPAIGVFLMGASGFSVVFLAAALVGVTSMLLSLPVREPSRTRLGGHPQSAKSSLIETRALFPSAVLFCFALTYASIVVFLPLYAVSRGLENPGLFFTVYAIVVIAGRTFSGRLSDVYGRAAAIVPGLLFGALALGILALATSLAMFVIAAVLYGLAFALVLPALSALAVDRVGLRSRGAAMGTFTAAMDLGIAAGSFGWGYLVQATSFQVLYLVAVGPAALGLVVFLAGFQGVGGAESVSTTGPPGPV